MAQTITATLTDTFPWFELKFKRGAISSVNNVAAATPSKTLNAGTADAAAVANYVAQLVLDLKTRGVIS